MRYIFFVIANEVKQSLEVFTAMPKKDAATIGAMGYSINQNFFQIEDSA